MVVSTLYRWVENSESDSGKVLNMERNLCQLLLVLRCRNIAYRGYKILLLPGIWWLHWPTYVLWRNSWQLKVSGWDHWSLFKTVQIMTFLLLNDITRSPNYASRQISWYQGQWSSQLDPGFLIPWRTFGKFGLAKYYLEKQEAAICPPSRPLNEP